MSDTSQRLSRVAIKCGGGEVTMHRQCVISNQTDPGTLQSPRARIGQVLIGYIQKVVQKTQYFMRKTPRLYPHTTQKPPREPLIPRPSNVLHQTTSLTVNRLPEMHKSSATFTRHVSSTQDKHGKGLSDHQKKKLLYGGREAKKTYSCPK